MCLTEITMRDTVGYIFQNMCIMTCAFYLLKRALFLFANSFGIAVSVFGY